MNIATIGIDLAKNVFQLHGVNGHGKVVLRRQIHRGQMRGLFVNLPPCLIGMEACASAHYWARTLESYGHTVRLIAPHFVKPYLKTHKTDATDAEAICEAVSRRTCALCRSRASSNSRPCHCTACARVLCGRALRRPARDSGLAPRQSPDVRLQSKPVGRVTRREAWQRVGASMYGHCHREKRTPIDRPPVKWRTKPLTR
jgi:hypothetical protein